jgi:hypothetical protein
MREVNKMRTDNLLLLNGEREELLDLRKRCLQGKTTIEENRRLAKLERKAKLFTTYFG